MVFFWKQICFLGVSYLILKEAKKFQLMVSYIEEFIKHRLYGLKWGLWVLLLRNDNLKTNFQSAKGFFFLLDSSVPCPNPKDKFPITENVNGECKEFCGKGVVLVSMKLDLKIFDYFEG